MKVINRHGAWFLERMIRPGFPSPGSLQSGTGVGVGAGGVAMCLLSLL